MKINVSYKNASTNNGGIFEGWGTSLCWWANRVGYSDTLAEKCASLFFSPDNLGLNIMRYNIGGGDDPTHDHIQRTDSAVPGWLSADGVYDYEADHDQLNVLIRSAKAAGDDAYVEVFSNSPPYFMTVSGCSSGSVGAASDNLREDMVDDFTEYMAHVTEYIEKDLGVRVKSFSPMNEPDTDYWPAFGGKQEGCHITPGALQSKLLVSAKEALRRHGLDDHVDLAACDETSTDKTITSYEALTPEAKAAVDRISTHSYGEARMAELGEFMKKENRHLWMSEVDGGEVAFDSRIMQVFLEAREKKLHPKDVMTDELRAKMPREMGAGLWFAKKIIRDMNALSPSAWVMWLVVDNHVSENGYRGKKDSGMVNTGRGYWGLAVADHDKEEVILTKKYYSYGQFSRYIRPGATIIHSGDTSLSAYDAKNKTLTVVTVNDSYDEQNAEFTFDGFKLTGDVKIIRTSEAENWNELPEECFNAETFNASLPPYSVTTFVFGAEKE